MKGQEGTGRMNLRQEGTDRDRTYILRLAEPFGYGKRGDAGRDGKEKFETEVTVGIFGDRKLWLGQEVARHFVI